MSHSAVTLAQRPSSNEDPNAKPKNMEDEMPKHEEAVEDLDPEYEKLLQTDPMKGLSNSEVEQRLERFGPNGKTCQEFAFWNR